MAPRTIFSISSLVKLVFNCAMCFQSDLIPKNSYWEKWEKYVPQFQSDLTAYGKWISIEFQ